MPSGPLAHICLLVEDLDKAVEDWRRILGILDPQQLQEQVVRYEDFSGGEDTMRWATFVSHGGAEIQLMEPGPDTPLGRRLAKHGEHVHHICFTTSDVESKMQELRDAGTDASEEIFEDPSMPWQRWSWVGPKSAHGTLVEVARPYRAVAGRWESASDA
ncbi:MAG: VOC family protein [Solirubrobacteraceae bacterium]